MNKSCVFILNNQEFNKKFDLKFFYKLGENICGELYSKGKYFVQSKVSNEIFETFLEFLIDEIKYPDININNYYEYFILSNEFNHSLSDYLLKNDFDSIRTTSFIQKAISKEINDKKLIEEYISNHLDYYLEYYTNEMKEIPITTLYNIFQNKKRILNNQERGYQFIKQILEDETKIDNKKSICVLLETLDSNKLDEKSFKESIEKREERFGFAPKLNLTFIDSINENISEFKFHYEQSFNEFMKKQQEMINQMKNFFEENIKIIHSNYIELLKRSDETKNDIKEISKSIQSIENKIDQNSKKNDDTVKQIQNLSSTYGESKKEILNISNIINEIKKKNDEITSKSEHIMNIFLADHGIFNGIIHQLTQQCGGNVADKKIVNITSSSIYEKCYPKNAVDFEDDNYFLSENKKNQWLQFDFINKKVKPIYYSIKSRYYGKGVKNLMNWVIEGSNTLNDWVLLDRRYKITSLDESGKSQTFFIQKKPEFYRYLRIRQIETNSENNDYLSLSSIEFYGSIQ